MRSVRQMQLSARQGKGRVASGPAVMRVDSSLVERWQNGLGLQLAVTSRSMSTNVGPAGRRRLALGSGRLARSLARRRGAHRRLVAEGIDAADLVPRAIV